MEKSHRKRLYPWTWEQLSYGRMTFTTEEAMQALGVSRGAFHDAAEKLQHKQRLLCPRRGFYVIVSPEWLKLGSPPPELFIDKLMRYVGRPYYVALHQAAYLHGAKHLATSDFQVITDKRMPIIKTGQSRIVFFYRKNINNIERGLDNSQTHARFLKISSPELTALELLSYPRAVGSIENIATILAELGPKIKARKLADLSEEFSKPNVQRLGYLFERLGFANCVRVMKVKLFKSEVNWTELITNETVLYNSKSKQVELNKNWRIVVRFELRFDH